MAAKCCKSSGPKYGVKPMDHALISPKKKVSRKAKKVSEALSGAGYLFYKMKDRIVAPGGFVWEKISKLDKKEICRELLMCGPDDGDHGKLFVLKKNDRPVAVAEIGNPDSYGTERVYVSEDGNIVVRGRANSNPKKYMPQIEVLERAVALIEGDEEQGNRNEFEIEGNDDYHWESRTPLVDRVLSMLESCK